LVTVILLVALGAFERRGQRPVQVSPAIAPPAPVNHTAGRPPDAPAATPPTVMNSGPHVRDSKVNSRDGLKCMWIPPETFMMGCSPGDTECDSDEKPAHEVTISKGFWLGQTDVTQAAYQRVIGSNPSYFKGDSLPVEQVTWDEARSYCQAIGGRLPTEAEWEYAARAGSSAACYGNLDDIAWYSSNSGGRTHEAGQKQANAFGLYDMLGNVWQWTADRYGEGTTRRALRGGSWLYNPRGVPVSYRSRLGRGYRFSDIGFRCVVE
jgi:formylglycine-generating enzyme required for sulfatase activity